MKVTLLVAATLMTLTAFVHVFWGGPEIMPTVRNAPLPRQVRAVMDVVWHGISVVLISIAGGLFWLTWHENPPLLWVLNAIQIGFAGLFIWYGIKYLGTLRALPQWIIFLGVPALSVWGVY